ncbi:hypothetical protein RUND412_000909 [Rhizina undulata]
MARKAYLFHEDDNLEFCPIFQFSDNAFEALNPEIPGIDGIRTSPGKALPYDTFHAYPRRLGHSTGFMGILTSVVRRGTVNAVDGVVTTAERNQISGHPLVEIFEQYYISQRIERDIQAFYLGRPSLNASLRAVGRMSRVVIYVCPRYARRIKRSRMWTERRFAANNTELKKALEREGDSLSEKVDAV